jgi:para-nitrobenzyl esterase
VILIKSMTSRGVLCALILSFLVSATTSRSTASPVQEVPITGGRIQGVLKDTVVSFKGIPFAAPPVGALRWKPPRPVNPWRGISKADRFAPPCAQGKGDDDHASSEDCLYLNVWTAAESSEERRPVMVWIHGGGFTGSATSESTFDGTRFAQQGVVLVSTAYRLGVFGFLAHPELDRESGKDSGNYGLQDMIAALKWVRVNIANFGGDLGRRVRFGSRSSEVASGESSGNVRRRTRPR